MKRIRLGIENHASIEHRQNAAHFVLHGLVPNLQAATITFIPILVEIYQDIHPPVQMQLRMNPEIGMDSQFPTGRNFMKAATIEIWIGQKTLHRCEPLQKLQERG